MPTGIYIGAAIGGGGGLSEGGGPTPANGFKYSVNTSNTDAGSSNADQHTLPVGRSGTYSFDVDWGDGNSDNITAWNQAEVTHTYAASGTYTIEITGTFTGINFSVDPLKLIEIFNWGASVLTINSTASFRDTTNASCSATDSPIISGAISQCFFQSGISAVLLIGTLGLLQDFVADCNLRLHGMKIFQVGMLQLYQFR